MHVLNVFTLDSCYIRRGSHGVQQKMLDAKVLAVRFYVLSQQNCGNTNLTRFDCSERKDTAHTLSIHKEHSVSPYGGSPKSHL